MVTVTWLRPDEAYSSEESNNSKKQTTLSDGGDFRFSKRVRKQENILAPLVREGLSKATFYTEIQSMEKRQPWEVKRAFHAQRVVFFKDNL